MPIATRWLAEYNLPVSSADLTALEIPETPNTLLPLHQVVSRLLRILDDKPADAASVVYRKVIRILCTDIPSISGNVAPTSSLLSPRQQSRWRSSRQSVLCGLCSEITNCGQMCSSDGIKFHQACLESGDYHACPYCHASLMTFGESVLTSTSSGRRNFILSFFVQISQWP